MFQVLLLPSMLALVLCCSYRLIVDAASPSLSIGTVKLQWRHVVIFSASTLIIFMFKKAYAKVRRRRGRIRSAAAISSGGDRHVISCVLLCARTKLAPASTKQRLRLTNFVRNQPATASSTQQLRLALHGSFIVDPRRVFLSENLLKRFMRLHMQVVLYMIAITGLVATATAWILLLRSVERRALVAGASAFTFSLVFVLTTAALAQKDLLRLLLWNFDVLFSTAQATVLALCLLDLLQWQVPSSLAVVTWWLWFLWILMLDALTPSVTQTLRLRKLALPVVVLVLLIAGACAVDIVMCGDDTIFKPRLLFTLSLPELGTYHEYTDALAVQRIVTIIGWNARLLFELALSDPNQLIFIRRRVEYSSPFLTFSEPLPAEQQVKTNRSQRWGWKQLRPVTVAPGHVALKRDIR